MIGHITIVWKKQKSKTCLNKTYKNTIQYERNDE